MACHVRYVQVHETDKAIHVRINASQITRFEISTATRVLEVNSMKRPTFNDSQLPPRAPSRAEKWRAFAVQNRVVWLLILLGVLAYLPAWRAITVGGVPFRDDAVSLFWPWRSYTRDALWSGTLPLWNPFSQCGMPFLANIQTSVLYLPNALYWIFSYTTALLLDAIFHQILLMLGVYFLARSLRLDGLPLSRSSAFLAACGVGLGAAVASHITFGHTTWHAARAYIPWELWATLWLLRTGKTRYAVALALLFCAQFAAGYPPMSMLGLGLCAGLIVARSVSCFLQSRAMSSQTSSTRSNGFQQFALCFASRCAWPAGFAWKALGALILCAMLSAVFVLPMLEVSRLSVHGDKMPFEMVSVLSGRWPMMLRLMLPNYFGGNISQWSVIEIGAHEQAGFCGLILLVFALITPWMVRAPVARWLWALLPISLLLSLGDLTPLLRWLYDHFSLFQKLRVPARWIEVWALAVPLLAALTFETVLVRADAERRARLLRPLRTASMLIFAALLAGTVATMLTPDEVWFRRLQWAQPTVFPTLDAATIREAIADFRVTALLSCILGLLTVGLLTFLLMQRDETQPDDLSVSSSTRSSNNQTSSTRRSWFRFFTLPRVVIGLASAELLLTFWQMDASLPPASLQKSAQFGGALSRSYKSDQRWQTSVDYQQSNANIAHHIDSFAGYDAMMSSRYFEFARHVEKVSDWNAWLFFSGDATPLLRVSGTTYLLAAVPPKQISPRAVLVQKDGDESLWRYEKTWPRVYLSRRVERVAPNQQLARLTKLASNDFARQWQPSVVSPDFASRIGTELLTREDRVLDWSRTLNTMTTRTQTVESSFLVQSEAFAPGWRAWVNGRAAKVENANYLFRGVPVPAGRARTVLVYEPESFRVGLFFSLCALAALAALVMCGITKMSRKNPASP